MKTCNCNHEFRNEILTARLRALVEAAEAYLLPRRVETSDEIDMLSLFNEHEAKLSKLDSAIAEAKELLP